MQALDRHDANQDHVHGAQQVFPFEERANLSVANSGCNMPVISIISCQVVLLGRCLRLLGGLGEAMRPRAGRRLVSREPGDHGANPGGHTEPPARRWICAAGEEQGHHHAFHSSNHLASH
eukprot:12982850-Heterocapsa_arctica.AAC.1